MEGRLRTEVLEEVGRIQGQCQGVGLSWEDRTAHSEVGSVLSEITWTPPLSCLPPAALQRPAG